MTQEWGFIIIIIIIVIAIITVIIIIIIVINISIFFQSDATPVEYSMAQLRAGNVTSSTTFSNPVYEMEESSDTQSMATTPSSIVTPIIEHPPSSLALSSSQSLDVKPEPSSAVIG